jgi:two-component system chemotaxis response regulator CheB
MNPAPHRRWGIVAIGASAGGIRVIRLILKALEPAVPAPILIVQHMHPSAGGLLGETIGRYTVLPVLEIEDKAPVRPGFVYVAPPNYHVLLEDPTQFALTVDERVNYARPSIDVTFESVADVYGKRAIGVVLTGANHDGAQGLRSIKQCGGLAIVQDPETAEAEAMPRAALDVTPVDYRLSPDAIGPRLALLLGEEEP